jgi:hypothetical protein
MNTCPVFLEENPMEKTYSTVDKAEDIPSFSIKTSKKASQGSDEL